MAKRKKEDQITEEKQPVINYINVKLSDKSEYTSVYIGEVRVVKNRVAKVRVYDFVNEYLEKGILEEVK